MNIISIYFCGVKEKSKVYRINTMLAKNRKLKHETVILSKIYIDEFGKK